MPHTVAAPSPVVRLASQSAISFVGYIFTFALGFPFQIFIAQTIGASGVGLVSLVDTGTQMIAGLLGLGVAPAMLRWVPFYRTRRRLGTLRAIITTGLITLVVAGFAGYGALLLASSYFKELLPSWDKTEEIALVLGLQIPLGMVLYFLMETLRGFGDVRSIVIGNSFLQLSVKFILVAVLFSVGWRELGLASAMVLALTAAVIYLARALWTHLSPLWSQSREEHHQQAPAEWIAYAKVMYVSSLIGILIAPVDRFVLGSWGGTAAVGVYAIIMTLYSATGVVQLMLLTVAAPMFSEIDGAGFDKKQAQHLYQVCTDWIMRATLPAVLFLALFGQPTLHLFGAEFAEKGAVPLLIMVLCQGLCLAVGPGGRLLKMVGYEVILLKWSVIQAFISIISFLVMIPLGGVLGAACAVAFNLVISNAVALWIYKREAKMEWYSPRYRRWIIPALLTVVVSVLIRPWLGEQAGALTMLLVLGLCYLIFHGAYFLEPMEAEDAEVWHALLKKIRPKLQWVSLRHFHRATRHRVRTTFRRNQPVRRLARPVVIFQSDDWGLTGIPSPAGIERLKPLGFGTSPWDRYGLETQEDLEALAKVLSKHRDLDGNPACFTANFILANADLRRMKEESFAAFRTVPIHQGFPAPWQDSLVDTYRDLVNKGLFYPGMHGYTHFGVEGFLAACRDPGEKGRLARALVEQDLAFSGSLTPEYHFALVQLHHGQEVFLDRDHQAPWVAEGIRLYKETFGRDPVSTCAPGYRCNDDTVDLWREQGLRVVQTSGGRELKPWNGLLDISRNTNFEPLLHGPEAIELALAEAERAVKQGMPIVICSHSINYITRHNHHGEAGRAMLDQFLSRLLERFPNLAFLDDARLADIWELEPEEWFVSPGAVPAWQQA